MYINWIESADNIDFSYSGFIGNTLDIHHLIWKSKEEGGLDLQDRVVESVFRAYFEEDMSLGEPLVMKKFVECTIMVVSLVLQDRTDARHIEVKYEMEKFWTRFSCSAVMMFVVDSTYVLSDAQPP